MTDNFDSSDGRRRTVWRWKRARKIAEALGCGSKVAWNWMRTLKAKGVDLKKLEESDAEEIKKAKEVMQGERLKKKWISPDEKAVTRTIEETELGPKTTLRQRVRIMLWAVGKCGSIELAQEALDRTKLALSDGS